MTCMMHDNLYANSDTLELKLQGLSLNILEYGEFKVIIKSHDPYTA